LSILRQHFWYIACESHELKKDAVIHRQILGEWLAIFRDENNQAVVFLDRCIHRNAQLSKGWVKEGRLQCPYHGWVYKADGSVDLVPSEGAEKSKAYCNKKAKTFEAKELDDFIYVRLARNENFAPEPFPMPHYKEKGYETVRLFNIFHNSVLNCAENYVDVPHTVFVHNKIFRTSSNKMIKMRVERREGNVEAQYLGETDNLGWFSKFLNPKKVPLIHFDRFLMPNVTNVEYKIGNKEFWITSHCTPVTDTLTHVWTDLTFKFSPFDWLIKPIVKFQGQKVIDQDIQALNMQMEVIKKYGSNFSNSSADIIHIYIESITQEIENGNDPRLLPIKKTDVDFFI
jgi:phenylpropionate dioxygenase-like ring-hydroxylating dioxygenase large terminal subunit